VIGSTGSLQDIFVHDRDTGLTQRVSVATNRSEANRPSEGATISADGRYVGFGSDASNLVSNDANSAKDIFVHDRKTGATERVSVASDGTEGNSYSCCRSAFLASGRYVAFTSLASNLVFGDANGEQDVFLYDPVELRHFIHLPMTSKPITVSYSRTTARY
jgi:Tol biopolymer transport system component